MRVRMRVDVAWRHCTLRGQQGHIGFHAGYDENSLQEKDGDHTRMSLLISAGVLHGGRSANMQHSGSTSFAMGLAFPVLSSNRLRTSKPAW
jgi:hypothetical protein